jgi:two-component system, LuxR family, sensor kinase FixL
MRFYSLSDVRLPLIGVAYLCGYVLLGRYSDMGAYSIAWRPSTGLSFCLVLLYGRRMLPLLFLAPLLARIVNPGLVAPFPLALIEAFFIGGVYALAAVTLLRPGLEFNVGLRSLRDVSILLIAAIISSTVAAGIATGVLYAANQPETVGLTSIALHDWIADITGISIIGAFGLLAMTRERFIPSGWKAAIQVAIMVLAIVVVVDSARNAHLQLSFLLFLPITWIAVSSGLEGVSIALLATQIGVVVALHFLDMSVAYVIALQARMAVLTVTGLVAGALVTQTQNAERKLRENQAAVARLSRLGSMGELAIAIAHEVNQPLSAAGTYSRLVTEALAEEKLNDPTLIATAKKATAQVERAAVVIKRLRALVRLGRSEITPVALEQIVEDTLDLVRPVLIRSDIVIDVQISAGMPPVLADSVQIGQLLINLLRNAAEAISGAAMSEGKITLTAVRNGARYAEVTIADTGPGFPASLIASGPDLFASNKAEGLGVGLFISRSIVESHGGIFRLASTKAGAQVSFTLPFAEGSPDDQQD